MWATSEVRAGENCLAKAMYIGYNRMALQDAARIEAGRASH